MAEPQVIGRYVLHAPLASGGMATVHLGRLLGAAGFTRTVAIKRMHAQFAQDPDFADMFLDEARLAGRIRHPNVVSVIDVVATDGEMLLVMEYVEGESLSKLLRLMKARGQKVPPAVASAIVCDALDGLHAAHEACDEKGELLGIVHRDVSPQNIMVGVDGAARVLDFGIAKAANRVQVTQEGQLKGKLSYMAPEQLHGKVTVATDVHAMGIILWECLAGRRLFAAETEGHTVTKILSAEIVPPSKATDDVPEGYDAVVAKSLEKDPDKRYASAREMSIALAACARKAETHEVAAWVATVAKDVLATRAEVVSQVESQPSMPFPSSAAHALNPGDTRSDLSTDTPSLRRAPNPLLWVSVGATAIALVAIGAIALGPSRDRSPPPTTAAVPTPSSIPSASTSASVVVVPSAAPSIFSSAAPSIFSSAAPSISSAPSARRPQPTGSPVARPTATATVPRTKPTHETLPDHL